MDLTNTDKAALKLIRDNGGKLESRPSCIGFTLFPDDRKYGHRSSQGMALCGGKAMRQLEKKGLITIYGNQFDGSTIYRLVTTK